MTAQSISTRIIQSPDIMGGQAHIEGRRIRVKDIVNWFELLGWSADEIADSFQLTLADVYSALAYYHTNQPELTAVWEKEQILISKLKKDIPSKIDRKRIVDGTH